MSREKWVQNKTEMVGVRLIHYIALYIIVP